MQDELTFSIFGPPCNVRLVTYRTLNIFHCNVSLWKRFFGCPWWSTLNTSLKTSLMLVWKVRCCGRKIAQDLRLLYLVALLILSFVSYGKHLNMAYDFVDVSYNLHTHSCFMNE